jgi:hypothetical protein
MLVVPLAVTILVTSGIMSMIAPLRPCTPVAVLPPQGISIEDIQHRVDVKSLPDQQITDLY